MRKFNVTPLRKNRWVCNQAVQGRIIAKSWVARVLAWALKKTNHTVVVDVGKEEIEFVEIQVQSLQSLIDEIYSIGIDYEIDRIIIGRKLFRAVVEEMPNWPVSISGVETRTLLGVPVQYLPWMEGFVVVPKLKAKEGVANGR